jgi:hypothetical protein
MTTASVIKLWKKLLSFAAFSYMNDKVEQLRYHVLIMRCISLRVYNGLVIPLFVT